MTESDWREVTLVDIDETAEDVVRMVVEGWYVDEPLDPYGFLDLTEAHLFSDAEGRRWCLPSDLDHEVNRRLLALGRKHRKALRSV